MNKRANWTLEAIFGLVGLLLLGDAFITKSIPINHFLEFIVGGVLLWLSIKIRMS